MKPPIKWLSQIGAKGGKATSEAKKLAAQANGRRGGRPRKPKVDSQSMTLDTGYERDS